MVENIFGDFVTSTYVISWSASFVLLMVRINDSKCYNEGFYGLHMCVCVCSSKPIKNVGCEIVLFICMFVLCHKSIITNTSVCRTSHTVSVIVFILSHVVIYRSLVYIYSWCHCQVAGGEFRWRRAHIHKWVLFWFSLLTHTHRDSLADSGLKASILLGNTLMVWSVGGVKMAGA